MKPSITVVSLGPGDPGLMTLQTADALRNAKQLVLRTEQHGVAAELVHAHLECGDGTQRGLLEEHGDVLAVQTVGHLAGVNLGLQAGGDFDGFEDFFFTHFHNVCNFFCCWSSSDLLF